MKFDVIIGNPPYQMSDGSGKGSGAMPIYQKFLEESFKLKPHYLTMIIPARWYSGGRGLDKFREKILHDDQLHIIHDFPNSSDCFAGVQVEGGICYFLWEQGYHGLCTVYSHLNGKPIRISERPLLEKGTDSFLRNDIQVSILHKIIKLNYKSFQALVSANDPFGYDIRIENSYKRIKPEYTTQHFINANSFYYFGWQKTGLGYVTMDSIRKGKEFINSWKIFITQAYGMGNSFPTQVINKPFVVGPYSCCTETYVMIGPFQTQKTALQKIQPHSRRNFFH